MFMRSGRRCAAVCEVKARKIRTGFYTLERWLGECRPRCSCDGIELSRWLRRCGASGRCRSRDDWAYGPSTILCHHCRMPEHRDLTLLDPENKLGRDVAIMRAEIEELRAKLARMPAVIARAALGIIFCTSSSRRFSDRGFWRINRHRRTRA